MAIKLDKSAIVKNLVQRHKLVPHIERAIGQGEFEWEYKFEPKQDDDAFHPSGHCIPSAYDLWLGITNPEPRAYGTGLIKAFQVGHWWHQYLQWIIRDRLSFCDNSAIERRGVRRWTDGPYGWATGAGDIAPCDIPGHGEWLIDIKTMGSHDFKRNGLPGWCAAKYEAQINIYMDFFDLDRALIVCVLKDSPHDLKEFAFERNDELITQIYDKWELVSSWLNESVTPIPEPEPELKLLGPVHG